ncbi:hypothetical protein GCM10010254_07350 [Streptomyces chromofuscus]|uniref:Uncharacterized protein n=1 Tax=Streptomyces chromofuscus TaxID=42881 RepID=A0A7M2T244_STRCW|nr:hypothetical protein IPT68_23165 [Streptomyces chromofuscus]GGS90014.1 hypothetical protein GCM10010254_07350 [Streptomyces chromofuscus]
MGKIVLMMSVSLDGCIEGPDRDLGRHRIDEEVHQHFNDVSRDMGAFLDGRVAYPPGARPADLRLVETATFGNGVVLLRYDRANARTA